jgi:hypothetical protein
MRKHLADSSLRDQLAGQVVAVLPYLVEQEATAGSHQVVVVVVEPRKLEPLRAQVEQAELASQLSPRFFKNETA